MSLELTISIGQEADIKAMLDSYTTIDPKDLTSTSTKYKFKAHLFHISKNNKPVVINISVPNGTKKLKIEKSYFRLLFFISIDQKSIIALIIDKNSENHFWKSNFQIDKEYYIIKPKRIGLWQGNVHMFSSLCPSLMKDDELKISNNYLDYSIDGYFVYYIEITLLLDDINKVEICTGSTCHGVFGDKCPCPGAISGTKSPGLLLLIDTSNFPEAFLPVQFKPLTINQKYIFRNNADIIELKGNDIELQEKLTRIKLQLEGKKVGLKFWVKIKKDDEGDINKITGHFYSINLIPNNDRDNINV